MAGTGARATGAGFVALPRRAGLAGEPRELCFSATTATRLRATSLAERCSLLHLGDICRDGTNSRARRLLRGVIFLLKR